MLRSCPRSGRIAWKRRSGLSLAEPPAESPLPRLDLGFGGKSRELQSPSFWPGRGGKALQHRFNARPSSLARLCGPQQAVEGLDRFSRIRSITWGLEFQKFNQRFAHHRVNRCHEPRVAELWFWVWPSNSIRHLHPKHSGEALRVFSPMPDWNRRLCVLPALFGKGVEGAGEHRFEAPRYGCPHRRSGCCWRAEECLSGVGIEHHSGRAST